MYYNGYMRIFVHAKAGAKKEQLKRIDPAHFAISVREPREAGRANDAIGRALADHFGIARSRIRLIFGATSANKVFNLE